jgi:DNA-binding PadR family transcriptional regulator
MPDIYGVPIRQYLSQYNTMSQFEVTLGALYSTIESLEKKGYITS